MLPNLVIAGVNKAGTTSLFAYLASHPEVCGSSVKETCYFLPLRYGEQPEPLAAYEKYFAGCHGGPVVMEATPGYFYGGRPLAEAMAAALPGVRVVIVFRDPVGRLVSFFRFQQSRLLLPSEMTLAEYVDACAAIPDAELMGDQSKNPYFGLIGGYYDRWLDAWTGTFGDHLKVLFADDLQAETEATLAELAGWLGIDPHGFNREALTAENRTVAYRRPGAQRVALALNERLEHLFRSQPAIKRRLRSVYYRFNAADGGSPADADTVAAIRARYAPSLAATAAKLEAAGVSSRPKWLSG